MPLPTPNTGESQDDFHSRCMASDVMGEDFPDQAQRNAVCYNQWRHGRGAATRNMHTVINQCLVNFALRTETLDGREHLVAPVVMMTEGVHAGSGGAMYYPAEELAAFAMTWNGAPVTVEHPQDHRGPISANHPEVVERQTVGRVYNAHWDGKRLVGEVWVDTDKAGRVAGGPEALRYLRSAGQLQLEVSTGLYSDSDGVPGRWGAERYEGTVRNIRPDHLALLPGGRGACSWEDGCGIRVNAKRGGDGMELEELATATAGFIAEAKGQPEQLRTLARRFALQMGYAVSEAGFQETGRALQQLIDGWDRREGPGAPVLHYLREVYRNTFVYTREAPDGSKLYKLPYSIDRAGAVSVPDGAEPVEVRMKTEYVAANASPLVAAAAGARDRWERRALPQQAEGG